MTSKPGARTARRVRRGDGSASSTASETRAGLTRAEAPSDRRRASRSLWAACEALLSAGESRALNQALDQLRRALACDGVAIHAAGPSGAIEPWCARGAWRTVPGDLRDCVTVPLFRAEERIGTLDLKARAGQRWRPGQLGLIRTAAGALGAALGARLELERLRHQPGRDPVTGLPDGRTFHARLGEELARARRHGLPLSVVTVDLDHFAALNTRYGRNVGDLVLSEVALLLRFAVRESDVVTRLGGDGFAVLLPETDAAPAWRCAERIRRSLEEHRFARVGSLSVSAGVAASPRDGVDGLELITRAEQALAIAKKSGRRRVVASPHAHIH